LQSTNEVRFFEIRIYVVTFDVILVKKYDSGKNIHLKNKPRKRAWR